MLLASSHSQLYNLDACTALLNIDKETQNTEIAKKKKNLSSVDDSKFVTVL
jgi:hypothetical protein